MSYRKKQHRSKSPPFVRLFNYVIDSPGYRALSMVGRAALIEVARLYNGMNNGQLALSARDLGDRIGKSKSTAARALIELEDMGFIETVRMGRFSQRNRKACEYRLTFFRCDVSHALPSKAFFKYGKAVHGIKSVSNGPMGGTEKV